MRAITIACLSLLLAAPSLGGCVLHTADSNVAAPSPGDSLVSVEADTDDAPGGLGAELTSSPPDGFLFKSTDVTVVDPAAERVAVTYESPWAAAALEQAIAARYRRGDAIKVRSSSSNIPLLWGNEQRIMLSKNAFFNEQVASADSDRSRTISNDEARRYVTTALPMQTD